MRGGGVAKEFANSAKPVPLMVNVMVAAVGLPGDPVELRLSVKLNVPKPSTFCGELKVMLDEVALPPVNVSLADVTVPARLRLAACCR